MTNHEGNNSYNELFRDKMDQIDYPYDNSQWNRLEKELNSSGISNQKGRTNSSYKTVGVVSSVVVIAFIAALLYFLPQSDDSTSEITQTDIKHTTNKLKSEVAKSEYKSIIQNTPIESKSDITLVKPNEITVTKSIIANDLKPIIDIENEIEQKENKTISNNSVNKNSVKVIQEPDARFLTTVNKGCAPLKISFNPVLLADSIEYIWDFGDNQFSNEKNPVHTYKTDGDYVVSLSIKFPKSGLISFYNLPDLISVFPAPSATIVINSELNTRRFMLVGSTCDNIKWLMNDDFVSENHEIEHTFIKPGIYDLSCLLENEYSCITKLTEFLDINIKHNIPMPNAFSPDGDGTNDLFGPGQEFYNNYNLDFRIYNKSGELVFKNSSSYNSWDGVIIRTGKKAPHGSYVFILKSTDEYGNTCVKKGSVTLI